jgi:hypothetical protein
VSVADPGGNGTTSRTGLDGNEALQLAGLGARQAVDEGHGARVLVGRDVCLDEILQRLHHRGIAATPGFSTTRP